jgi:predicted unusual protein kinase regulating ubiquinone biosynthesis (AarF/ABC1/UbiB family)
MILQVQYPGLQQQFGTDIATMAFLSKAVAWVLIGLIVSYAWK